MQFYHLGNKNVSKLFFIPAFQYERPYCFIMSAFPTWLHTHMLKQYFFLLLNHSPPSIYYSSLESQQYRLDWTQCRINTAIQLLDGEWSMSNRSECGWMQKNVKSFNIYCILPYKKNYARKWGAVTELLPFGEKRHPGQPGCPCVYL